MPEKFDEATFRRWYAGHAKRWDLNPNPDAPEQQYDYRAAYRAGATPDPTGHWPSDFKLGGHPRNVDGGFDVHTGERVMGSPRARSAAELAEMGWDPETAQTLAATPEPPGYMIYLTDWLRQQKAKGPSR